jgi:hypothetical protein
LLLKDGLLKLYLRIQPYLPLVNSQVQCSSSSFSFLSLFLIGPKLLENFRLNYWGCGSAVVVRW